MFRTGQFILIFILFLNQSFAQNVVKYPKDIFTSPLDIPLVLAGTFAELRSNHFHSGIDIKTNGVEGLPVFSVADGYVSRIKVSPTGYGNALYITHPNGFTSVYAHLSDFSYEINQFVNQKQYEKKTFALNLFPEKEQFQFKQGAIIGLSGNSGGSVAPHLHFEIRNTHTEEPINPLLFGFHVFDSKKPIIRKLYVYPLDDQSRINGRNEKKDFEVSKNEAGDYQIHSKLEISGKVGFGIDTYDCQDMASNKNGVYQVQLFVNDSLRYSHQMECFAFHETRYINSLIDYEEKFCCKIKPQKSFIEPNNKLRIYNEVTNNGIIESSEANQFHVKYLVSDISGNASTLTFSAFNDPKSYPTIEKPINKLHFPYDQINRYDTEGFYLQFPEGCFYTDVLFSYARNKASSDLFSPLHTISPEETPIHERFQMDIIPEFIPEHLKSKALIVTFLNDGSMISAGGTWKGNKLSAKLRNMGTFTIALDTLAPEIHSKNTEDDMHLSKGDVIEFIISDDLSGIKKFNAFIDDKWVLLEYDAKKNRFFHTLDYRTKAGNHIFEIQISDHKENVLKETIRFSN